MWSFRGFIVGMVCVVAGATGVAAMASAPSARAESEPYKVKFLIENHTDRNLIYNAADSYTNSFGGRSEPESGHFCPGHEPGVLKAYEQQIIAAHGWHDFLMMKVAFYDAADRKAQVNVLGQADHKISEAESNRIWAQTRRLSVRFGSSRVFTLEPPSWKVYGRVIVEELPPASDSNIDPNSEPWATLLSW